ncbi:endonuclease III [bacterium]|nr:endonuclease III [bacterium]
MNKKTITEVISILREETRKFNTPIVTKLAKKDKDPFIILISTVISSRTKDETTRKVTEKLFKHVKTAKELATIDEEKLASLIFPAGFYRVKAKNLKRLGQELITRFNGNVPETIEELVSLPGVGRKTANLVLVEAFGKYGVCVDTHVHRISNRLGFVKTRTPLETEREIRKKLPKDLWKEYNKILVAFGQNICKPTNPRCDLCPVNKLCEKVGVRSKYLRGDRR